MGKKTRQNKVLNEEGARPAVDFQTFIKRNENQLRALKKLLRELERITDK